MAYKFHHIAIACSDIKCTLSKYEALGYQGGNIIWDNIQKVNVIFLKADGMPTIELVSSDNERSPIQGILQKTGVSPYHTCYITDDFEASIVNLEEQGFIKLDDPVQAIALNNKRIVFMYNIDSGLIEFMEE